jgi:hypothetical protein
MNWVNSFCHCSVATYEGTVVAENGDAVVEDGARSHVGSTELDPPVAGIVQAVAGFGDEGEGHTDSA